MTCPAQGDVVASGDERLLASRATAARGRARGRARRPRSTSDDQRGCLHADERREVPQDPRDLLALGDLGLAQAVRVVDRGERLDEERLARTGRVVHDARDAAAGRRLQRQHGPAAALGDEVVLEMLGERRVAGDLAQALGKPAAALAELAAEATQRRRGRVLEVRAILLDRAPDLVRDREQGGSIAATSSSSAGIPSRSCERPARRHAGADRALDVREACACRACLRGRRARRLADVGDPTEVRLGRRRRAARSPRPSAVGATGRTSSSADGRSAAARSGSGLARGGIAQAGQDGRELEQLEIVLSHGASVRPSRL